VEDIGYPVRESIIDVAADRAALADEGRKLWDLDAERRTVVVTGGSQGALHLNQVVAGALPSLAGRDDLQLLILTGPAHEAVVSGPAGRVPGLRARVLPFLDRMELAYAVADLVVARAGATTLAELAVCGLPAVLVPYPHATEHHQDANARELARAGAAVMLPDAGLTPSMLTEQVLELLDDPDRLSEMADRARDRAKPDAAERFAQLVADVAAA
jgi:UDP-N-acetylglucosamine--N-acetylmuramyl-(pentapeptide) pyrophosphoryl-undecaprenol N-acetylglucosamine transferase